MDRDRTQALADRLFESELRTLELYTIYLGEQLGPRKRPAPPAAPATAEGRVLLLDEGSTAESAAGFPHNQHSRPRSRSYPQPAYRLAPIAIQSPAHGGATGSWA